MIKHELFDEEGLLIVTPQGTLKKEDFETLATIVDPFIETKGMLRGLMIYTESFAGWKNFAALISHLQFVKNHQKKILKVAAVTDSSFLSILPTIADHFVEAQVKHFNYNQKTEALAWLGEESD